MDPTQTLYRSKLKRSLSLRFALIVIACSTFFVVFSTALQLFFGYRNDIVLIENNVQFIEQSYLPSIADSLYKLDEDLLRLLLRGALQLRGIDYCKVSKDQEIGAWVIEGKVHGESDVVRDFALEYLDQKGDLVTIGTLTVGASFESAYERLWDNAPLYIVSSALEIFLTALVVFALFQLLVARHLATMANYTQTLGVDHLEPRLALGRPPRRDELDQVVDAINDLCIRLRQDMVNRKKAEAALKASHDRFQIVTDSLDAAVCVADMQSYEVLFVNQYGREVWGDVVGKICWQTLQSGQNAPCAFCTNENLVDENGKATGIYTWEVQNTVNQQWYECRAQAIHWIDGQFVRMEIATNITKRKQTEEELERYRDHLEELVAERTCELEQAQVELIRKERLSALGQLTATVAHELRNPLGTVRAAVFAICDAIEQGELHRVERARHLAERNIVRCDCIIHELLDYARGRERERALDLEPVYVDAWLDVLLDEQAILNDKHIVCVSELNASVQVPIDRNSFRRAVINVLNNGVEALKDMKSRGNQLTVSTRVCNERLEIRVSDTGCGIPADVMDKIFEPLFSTKTFGVGLGLSIVKNIMRQHNGGIEVQSQEGEGSTFTLWLPCTID